MKAIQVVTVLGCITWLGCAVGQRPPGSADRPAVYASTFPQFLMGVWSDPRIVTIVRAGAGQVRKAELWVFEIVDHGDRLQKLYETELRNAYMPWIGISTCAGRFYITFDDLFENPGGTDNCFVIYDLARGVSSARRLRDMVPPERLSAPGKHLDVYWHGAEVMVDPVRMLVYPTSPDEARNAGYPFLTVDLPSLSVQMQDKVPSELPREAQGVFAGKDAPKWEWSMGAAVEPAWNICQALPQYLRMSANPLGDSAKQALGDGGVSYFKFNTERCEYVRCKANEWTEPPKVWDVRK